ncbi:DUF2069 domain-containing protein [Leeia sp.]|uniref:DUF2069 domain-containing protein n=1 Tax=Leeia sp. TaxID=2884678 RepID=UPI0035AF4736
MRAAYWTCNVCLLGLIALSLAWELWLAPLRPGGSWLVLKVLPLLVPLFGILRGRMYTYKWMTMFVLLYFIEGVMRGWGDRGLSQQLALLEVVLSCGLYVSAILFVRRTRAAGTPQGV